MRTAPAFALATAALWLGVFTASPADAAPDKHACVDAATRGQIQRDDGKLSAAAEAFAVCAASSCPAVVRQSCKEWLADAKQKIPTVTVHIDDADANEEAPTLRIDGSPGAFDTPVGLDLGRHVVRVERGGKPPFVEEFTLTAGETKTIKARTPVPPPVPRSKTTRPVPTTAWILGGVAVVGFASWAVFGLRARSETDRLADECAPTCTPSERDGAFRTALVADISLGVAVVATAVAGVLFFTRPRVVTLVPPDKALARPPLVVSSFVGPSAGGVVLGGRF